MTHPKTIAVLRAADAYSGSGQQSGELVANLLEAVCEWRAAGRPDLGGQGEVTNPDQAENERWHQKHCPPTPPAVGGQGMHHPACGVGGTCHPDCTYEEPPTAPSIEEKEDV